MIDKLRDAIATEEEILKAETALERIKEQPSPFINSVLLIWDTAIKTCKEHREIALKILAEKPESITTDLLFEVKMSKNDLLRVIETGGITTTQ